MKAVISFVLSVILLFSFSGCVFTGAEITVENGIVHINSDLAPEITLLDEEDKKIDDVKFYEKLVEAVDGKSIDSSDVPEAHTYNCDCDVTYTIRMSGNYPYGYYLTLHKHGIDISRFCKFRKCMDLLGFVEVDTTTIDELIEMLVE